MRFLLTPDENRFDASRYQSHTLSIKVGVAFFLSSLVLVAVGGNLLVIISVFTDRPLKRKASNRFLVSLAVADLLTALTIMTFAIRNDISGRWDFGPTYCLIWNCLDVTYCTVSILSLCLICVDRHMQVTRPITYGQFMTFTKVKALIVMVWLISIFLAFVPSNLWLRLSPNATVPAYKQGNESGSDQCRFGFSMVYTVVSSTLNFYIPCAVMLVLYLEVSVHTRRTVKLIQQQISTTSSKIMDRLTNLMATLTVGVIIGVFIICWLPFFVINPVAAQCPDCIQPIMFQVFSWMGYANACANPIIYPLLNPDFRRAYRRKLLWGAGAESRYRTGSSMHSESTLRTVASMDGTRNGTRDSIKHDVERELAMISDVVVTLSSRKETSAKMAILRKVGVVKESPSQAILARAGTSMIKMVRFFTSWTTLSEVNASQTTLKMLAPAEVTTENLPVPQVGQLNISHSMGELTASQKSVGRLRNSRSLGELTTWRRNQDRQDPTASIMGNICGTADYFCIKHERDN